MRRRTALFTLLLLVVFAAVPIVLTWREVRQEQLNHALIVAVDHNDVRAVRRLLRQGADSNTLVLPDDKHPWWKRIVDLLRHGSVPARASDQPVLAKAIEWFPNPDTTEEAADNVAIVKALLDAGADANRRFIAVHSFEDGNIDHLLTRPVVEAAKYGKWQTVQALLTHRADLNATDQYRNTALMFAAREWNVDLVKSLFLYGADGLLPKGIALLDQCCECCECCENMVC